MYTIETLIRDNIRDLQPYSSARDEFGGTEGIFLDANENPWGNWNRYPDPGQQALKARIAMIKEVDASQVFIGNGSDEIIDLLLRIFCRPGADKALTFTPTYGMYAVAAALNDVKLLELPLDKDFQIERSTLLPVLEDPQLRIIFICSPNNPTGNIIRDIALVLQQFPGIVVVDEAYIDFAAAPSQSNLLDRYPNLVILQTLSKAWGLAGARIGVSLAAPALTALLNKVKPPYNVSALNQQAALETLSDTDTFKQRRQVILEQRTLLQQALQQLPVVKRVYPSEANFLLAETENADAVYHQLIQQKIVVRNRSSQVPGCIRITVGSPGENIRLIQTLSDIKPC